jgi:hypothetical protein
MGDEGVWLCSMPWWRGGADWESVKDAYQTLQEKAYEIAGANQLKAHAEKVKASLMLDTCLRTKNITVLAMWLGLLCSLFRQDIG